MATLIGTQEDFKDALKSLIELDFAAVAAYQEAIQCLQDEECESKLRDFKEDHERHITALSTVVENLDQQPPSNAGIKQFFSQGRVMFANLMGDKAVLKAIKSNEDDAFVAYERLNEHPGKISDSELALKHGLEDVRRHREWLKNILDTL